MAYGTGEWRGADGHRLKMRHELREGRTQRHESHTQRHTVSDARAAQLANSNWLRIDTIALIGVYHNDERMAEIQDMLDMLEHQTPDIFDRYDEHDAHRYDDCHVSDAELGAFKTHDLWAEIISNHAVAFDLPSMQPE